MRKNNQKGFSLVEVMVAISITAILSAIAVPSYVGYQRRSARVAIKSDLSTAVEGYATYYISKNTFCVDIDDVIDNLDMTQNIYESGNQNTYTASGLGFAATTSGAIACTGLTFPVGKFVGKQGATLAAALSTSSKLHNNSFKLSAGSGYFKAGKMCINERKRITEFMWGASPASDDPCIDTSLDP